LGGQGDIRRAPMLTVRGLSAGYGHGDVLRGIDADVAPGEIVAVLGRNGSGRSTLAKAILGMLAWRGAVKWREQGLQGLRTFEIARLGIGYVPETRDVFGGLTVAQNLALGTQAARSGVSVTSRWRVDDVYQLFPALHLRRQVDAAFLSGGEQQMLALGRCLMGAPAMVVVDEPTEGLAPALVQQVADCLDLLRRQGVAVLLMEQKMAIALALADRVLVMGHGSIVFGGTPQQLRERGDVVREWLQV
jgi:branched-chain amino acid transport system ATP-binding protein